MFDTICHEHVAYYSTKIINELANKNGLKLIDVNQNNVNGGSMQYYVSKKNSNFKVNKNKIDGFIKKEKRLKIDQIESLKDFLERINIIKKRIKNFLICEKNKNKKIYVYGASTKGNVLLQYFGLDNKIISSAVERNPQKFGRLTPGTKIPIISEKRARKSPPDLFLVLPWHFKEEILKREKNLIKRGTRFLFPLPKFEIR
jgi:hypothetical protein